MARKNEPHAAEKSDHLLVVALADASAEPDAVVVKLHDTVVAEVAMAAASRSKYVTCLAELEFEEQRLVGQVHLKVVHPCFVTDPHVLLRHEALDAVPAACRHNARVARCRMHHEEIGQEEKHPERDNCYLPFERSVPVELTHVPSSIRLLTLSKQQAAFIFGATF